MRQTIFVWIGTVKEWREIQKIRNAANEKRRLEKMERWIKGK